MPGSKTPSEAHPLAWSAARANASNAGHTERLVRETWRHYYVAQLAEAQFGPSSLEASIARNRALVSYRELRGCLRELDPYYRASDTDAAASTTPPRHLRLVRDEAPSETNPTEP